MRNVGGLLFGNSRRLTISIVALMFVAAGAGTGTWLLARGSSPFPANITRTANYPLYYPGKLPAGWQINKQGVYTGSGVVGYTLKGPSDAIINVTVQPRPQGFDFNKFYTSTLKGSTQFLTGLGQACIGDMGGRLTGSLATESAWLLATPGPKNVSASTIRFILENLRQ